MKPLLPSDTIVCDTAQLKNYINCGKYNYDSELGDDAPSLFEKIQDAIGDWINDFFKDIFGVKDTVFSAHSDMRYVWIALAVIVLLVIAYFIYKKKMFFFSKKTKVEDDYQIVEDTIYGIDFDADIATALTSGNHKEAVRLKYLQCLKMLSDGSFIDWRIYKTPKQYTQEFTSAQFKDLTRRYVLVRYGNYNSSLSTYEEINALYEDIKTHLSKIPEIPVQEEGGDHED